MLSYWYVVLRFLTYCIFIPIRSTKLSTLQFLGLTEDWADTHQKEWTDQRLRLANRQCEDEEACKQLELQRKAVRIWKKNARISRKLRAEASTQASPLKCAAGLPHDSTDVRKISS